MSKRILYQLFLAAALLAIVVSAPAQERTKTFSDPALGLSFQYPDNWIIARSTEGGKTRISVYMPGKFSVNSTLELAYAEYSIDVYPGVLKEPSYFKGPIYGNGQTAFDYWAYANMDIDGDYWASPEEAFSKGIEFVQENVAVPSSATLAASDAFFQVGAWYFLEDEVYLKRKPTYFMESYYGYTRSATYNVVISCLFDGYLPLSIIKDSIKYAVIPGVSILSAGSAVAAAPPVVAAVPAAAPVSAPSATTIVKTSKDAKEYAKYNRPWGWFTTHTYDLGTPVAVKIVSGKVYAGPSENKGAKYQWQLRISEDGTNWTSAGTIVAVGAQETVFGPVAVNRTTRFVQIFTNGQGYVDDSGLTVTK